MDIHRCRFVEFPAPGISSLAFSHVSNPATSKPSDLRLAVGREGSNSSGGDIEIWNVLNDSSSTSGFRWAQERILHSGRSGQTVEQVAWTQDVVDSEEAEEVEGSESIGRRSAYRLRLFSIGGSAAITEWDLGTGVPKRQAEGNLGDLWCFAPQPRRHTPADSTSPSTSPSSPQLLAAGCSDGSIVLFSTEDDDLRFLRVLLARPTTTKKKAKVLSIAWRDSNTVVAGYENGTIRVVDLPSRRTLRQVSLGNSTRSAGASAASSSSAVAVVWAVKCLPDGTVVSGDSAGELKVWDGKNLSLVQTLRTHQSDILDIAFNASGDRLWTVGMDRRTVSYQLSSNTVPGVKTKRWVELSHRQFHKSDAKCIAAFESADLGGVLVSGGMDAGPIVQSMYTNNSNTTTKKEDGEEKKKKKQNHHQHHRTLPHLPQRAPISTTRRSRLFVSWWQQQIHVYHVAKRNQTGQAAVDSQQQAYSLVGTVQLKGDRDIESAAISDDGNLILASTSTGVRLFQVRVTENNTLLRSRQIDLPASLHRFGARLVGISPNSKWLYAVRMDNTVVLCKVILPSSQGMDSKPKPRIHKAITKLAIPSWPSSELLLPSLGGGAYMAGICAATFSPDSRVLAVGTLGGAIAAWVLTGHEDDSFKNAGEDGSPDGHSSRSGSDSDSDSDSDSESDTPTTDSQRWIATPDRKVSRFPHLESAITVLTFRPPPTSSSSSSSSSSFSSSSAEGTSTSTSTNIGLHATRRNAHPIAHEQPTPAPQLIAISANGTLIEVDVYTGRLSEWWRQQQQQQQPSWVEGILARTKDIIRGSFWDTKTTTHSNGQEQDRQRLWLYGSTVFHMLDVSPSSSVDAIAANTNDKNIQKEEAEEEKEKKCWSSFEYRSILGAGVIDVEGSEAEADADAKKENDIDAMDIDDHHQHHHHHHQQQQQQDIKNIEVVIVERPLWDIAGALE